MTHIVPYQNSYQADILEFMAEIAAGFSEPISSAATVLLPPPEHYWVALHANKAVGTVGISVLANNTAGLRKMFVKPAYRGKEAGVSAALLQTALDWCRTHHTQHLYLGTMSQFRGAQRFYEKNGFTVIAKEQLPADFPVNPIDRVFYHLDLHTAFK